MKGRWIPYSTEELAWIEARKHLPRYTAWLAFCIRFERFEVGQGAFKQLCQRKGWTTGRTGCFEKGSVPPNKGKKMPPGVGGNHPNARRTQFKKGNLPRSYRGPGYEFVDQDGYVWMIVAERNPHSGAATRSVMKHKRLWEMKHGPTPAGTCLKCLDGNKQNTDPSNWKLISRGALGIINRAWNGLDFEAAHPDVKLSIIAIAELKVAKRNRVGPARRQKAVAA